jgi:hypothetical protein
MLSSLQLPAQPAPRGLQSNRLRHVEQAAPRAVAAGARRGRAAAPVEEEPAGAPEEELDPSVVRSGRAAMDSTSRRRARRSPTAAPPGLDKQAQEVHKLTVKYEELDGCVSGARVPARRAAAAHRGSRLLFACMPCQVALHGAACRARRRARSCRNPGRARWTGRAWPGGRRPGTRWG